MAATPSKASPSNKSVEEGSATAAENSGAETEAQPAAAVDATTTATATLKAAPVEKEPSYQDSQESVYYIAAKSFLKSGDFEQALVTIEEGIQATTAALQAACPAVSENELVGLHPSLAPFHYMYGTTLLYSIEESNDDSQRMTNMPAGAEGGAPPENGSDGQEQADADDTQIAWENLDIAREMLEIMVKENPSSGQLKLDLAQVYLRTGDLQRLNGHYDNAVADYTACLAHQESSTLLGPYDRKIADAHYNLGLVYMMQVAETKAPDNDSAAAAAVEKKLADCRSRSFHHYLACGKALCGQIAFLCNQEPDELFQKVDDAIPKFKSTGEEDDNQGMDHPKIAGMKLQSLRKLVAELTPPAEDRDTFNDLVQLLEEIQETIDESENSEKGVHQVTDMKAEISAAVASQVGNDDESGGAAAATVGFGSAAAAASTAVAQPVMVVKKKKKRDSEDAKMPAQGNSAEKRAKSE